MPYSLCGSSTSNLGQQTCDVSKGVLKKVFIFNGSIAQADYADETTFFNKLVANSKLSKGAANKVFPLMEAQEISDASESNKEGSLNLGFKAVLMEGKPGYKVKMFAGADLLKRLRTFNNKTVRIIEYDANGVYWGTKSGTAFQGYQARLFFAGGKVATGQNVEEGIVEFTLSILSTSEYLDNSYWMESTSSNVDDIVPLIDIPLSYISNAANVFKIGIKIEGSNLIGPYNTYDEIGATLAGMTFTAGTGTNYGTALTITSVAVDAGLKALTVTFDSTAFTALTSGTKIKLNAPSTTALDAAGITETEILSVILTK